MTAFYLTTNNETVDAVTEELECAPKARTLSFLRPRFNCLVTRVDSMDFWSPAEDLDTGVVVAIIGRVALEKKDWNRASKLQYKGGLACRILLDRWLNQDLLESGVNGAVCVVVYDPRCKKIILITDRMGMIPVFRTTRGPLRFSSVLDVLALGAGFEGKESQVDWTTVVEFLMTGNSVQPYTYYSSIEQLDPGTRYEIDIAPVEATVSEKKYWKPEYTLDKSRDHIESVAEELSTAIQSAVQLRTHDFLGPSGVFLSGGVDSRGILFGLNNPSSAQCITFFDEPNSELRTAEKLAELAGATHHRWQRDFDYYGNTAAEIVRISSGQWSFIDGHYLGFLEKIDALGLGTVLTGCYADYMFKGLAINRKPMMLLGKEIPVRSLDKFGYEYYQIHSSVSEKYSKQILARLAKTFGRMNQDDYESRALDIENTRIRPISREPDSSGRALLWRTLPFDWAYSDTAVLEAYQKISYAAKINGGVFEKAVLRIVGKRGENIKNNNYGTRLGASEQVKVLQFLKGVVARKLVGVWKSKPNENSIATPGSWPNWINYLRYSAVVKELWGNPSPQEREKFEDMIGFDPWRLCIEEWIQKDYILLLRMITLRLWLRQHRLV
jgi:asparagine synthase (glutamine-hydrolysing)